MNAAAETLNQHDFWHMLWTVEKYHEDLVGMTEQERALCQPYETVFIPGNMLVNAGIQLLEDLLIGAGGTAFNNANSYLGVGDSNTAAAAGQTDLQAATNKLRKAMDATYPSRSSQTITWRSTFASGDANFAWAEWAIFNNSSGGTMLSRKVESLGTKTTGSWVLTATLVIS